MKQIKKGRVKTMNLEKYNMCKDLIDYLDKVLQFHYSQNDKGHGIDHAEYVIKRSLKFAEEVKNINYEMVYCVAVYHDIAHHIDAKNHEVLSAKMLREDEKLKQFFTMEQIETMSEAIEDHRSSMVGEPRNIYGKIVSSADRNTDVTTTLKRCYAYNKKHYPELNEEEIIEQCRLFNIEKFGLNGYARSKMYFEDKDYEKFLTEITNLALDKEKFHKAICGANGIKDSNKNQMI